MNPYFPLEEQEACLIREIGFRKRVYPKWVSDGRITQQQADEQIMAMECCLHTIRNVGKIPALMTKLAHSWHHDQDVIEKDGVKQQSLLIGTAV